jgi:hypothetical protein
VSLRVGGRSLACSTSTLAAPPAERLGCTSNRGGESLRVCGRELARVDDTARHRWLVELAALLATLRGGVGGRVRVSESE